MTGSQHVYKHHIRLTQTFQKAFRAMELIAPPRIGQIRCNAQEASPYGHALSQAVAALGIYPRFEYPITQERTDTKRMATLAVIPDRGTVGAYSATTLRKTGCLIEELVKEGKEPVIFTFGRRAQSYFSLRGMPIEFSWTGQPDRLSDEAIEEVATTLLDYFLQPVKAGGVAGVHIVPTRYVSMVSQIPEACRMLPLKVVDVAGVGEPDDAGNETLEKGPETKRGNSMPLYEFESGPSEVLDALLTRYMGSYIRNALLQLAASELANHQQAMYTAADNAEGLIITYTHPANTARQGDITQEITEIVSGADALGTEQAGKSPGVIESPIQTYLTKQNPLSALEDAEERTWSIPSPPGRGASSASSASSPTSSSRLMRSRRYTTPSR